MRKATKNQIAAIHAIKAHHAWDDKEYRGILSSYGVTTSLNLFYDQADNFIQKFGTKKQKENHSLYIGKGRGEKNDHLTQGQADEISRLQKKLDMDFNRLTGLIYRVLKKVTPPEMLMNYEASRLINVLQKMAGEK